MSTQDDPKFGAFALELAKRVAARQKPGATTGPAALSVETPTSMIAGNSALPVTAPAASTAPATKTKPAEVETKSAQAEVTPATFFAFLPAANRQGDPKYVAQDVFGYSFLSDVFMADYKNGNDAWQGFLRPYRDVRSQDGP